MCARSTMERAPRTAQERGSAQREHPVDSSASLCTSCASRGREALGAADMIDCIARTSGAAMKASCKARVSRLGVWPRSMYRTCCWMRGRDVSCGYRAHMSRYVDMAGPRCGANRLGCTRSGSPTMMPSAWVYARFAGTSCHVRTWPLLRTRVRPLGCDACSPWSCKALTSARTCSSLAAPARRRFVERVRTGPHPSARPAHGTFASTWL